jgi:hypothetical protein
MLTKIDNPAQLKLDLFTTVAITPIIFQPIPKPRQLRITKRREFTDWLDDLGVDRYENQANSFTKSDRSCSVSTHLIHIKP